MKLFDFLTGKAKKEKAAADMQARIAAINAAVEKTNNLLRQCLDRYNQQACPCAFPRFRQLAGINCVDYGLAFRSHSTEMLLHLAKDYFDTGNGERHNWVCKKCGSVFAFDWSDFSISLDRQTLQAVDIKTPDIGQPARKPLPLYPGLSGHGFPPETEIQTVTFEEFEAYMLEKE